MTPTTAPSLSLLLHRKLHLQNRIKYRASATYFQVPLKDLRELERIDNLIALHHGSKEAISSIPHA
jgi:hypothetical protein